MLEMNKQRINNKNTWDIGDMSFSIKRTALRIRDKIALIKVLNGSNNLIRDTKTD
jgi:hypothetical protein